MRRICKCLLLKGALKLNKYAPACALAVQKHSFDVVCCYVGSIMTAGGNLAWSAANIGGPGKLFIIDDLGSAPIVEVVVCG